MEFWLGFVTAIQIGQALAVGYILYRYVYTPWIVMRKDFVNYKQKFETIEGRIRQLEDKVQIDPIVMTDDKVALAERRLRERDRVRNTFNK